MADRNEFSVAARWHPSSRGRGTRQKLAMYAAGACSAAERAPNPLAAMHRETYRQSLSERWANHEATVTNGCQCQQHGEGQVAELEGPCDMSKGPWPTACRSEAGKRSLEDPENG